VIRNLAKRTAFVNHYSFHLMDPDWGHLVIKMSGHPPFAAQVILNGHEYVACQAQRVGVCYTKEGNCFTRVPDPDGLAQLADTLSSPEAVGRLVRSSTGGSTPRVCASGWTWPTSTAPASDTRIRSTRSSTPAT
jgi:hypothetical protein